MTHFVRLAARVIGCKTVRDFDAKIEGISGGDQSPSLAVSGDDRRHDPMERKAVACVGEHKERYAVRGIGCDGRERIVKIEPDRDV
jgi:hypothetical protein